MIIVKSLEDITNLRLEIPEWNVVEYFCVGPLFGSKDNGGGCVIYSGLRNVDEDIVSPYFYYRFFGGSEWEKNALMDFNKFLKEKGL